MKFIFFVISLLLLNWVLCAQKVNGIVYDNASGQTMTGVSIIVKGSSLGAVTNSEGKFSINASLGDTLVFSFVGFRKLKMPVSVYSITARMEKEEKEIDEIVVTALNIKRKRKSLGWAVTELNTKELQAVSEPSIAQSLHGKVAGVNIQQNSGGIMGGVSVIIRGYNSFTGNNQPLYIVDGVPVENSTSGTGRWGGRDEGAGINEINPYDIESVSVLKGASASALYGTRAASGVILITTKKGSPRKGLGVSFTSDYSFDKAAYLPEFQNIYGAGNMQRPDAVLESSLSDRGFPVNEEGIEYYPSTIANFGPKMTGQKILWWDGEMRNYTPQPDNYKKIWETGHTAATNIAFSNSNNVASYRLSLTNFDYKSIMPEAKQKRYTINLNTSARLSEKLTSSFSVSYTKLNIYNRPSQNLVRKFNAYAFPRSTKYDLLSEYRTGDGYSRQNTDPAYPEWEENNFWSMYENKYYEDKDRFIGNFSLDYEITDWLFINGMVGSDFSVKKVEDRNPHSMPGAGGYFTSWTNTSRDDHYEFLLSFNKNIGSLINLQLNAGGSRDDKKKYNNGSWTDGGILVNKWYDESNAINDNKGGHFEMHKQINSLFGFGTIAYKNFWFVDFSARNDWSSALTNPQTGVSDNSYFFPSVSTSIILTDAFDIKSHILDFAKFRMSFAQVGGDTDAYRISNSYNYGVFDGQTTNMLSTTVQPGVLKPEKTKEIEFGTEIHLFKHKIGFDFSVYSKRTIDQIISLQVAGSTGANSVFTNAGEMKNTGFETQIYATPVLNQKFNWRISFNFSKNISKVVSLNKGIQSLIIADYNTPMFLEARPGHPYGDWVTYSFKTDDNDNKIIDADGYYVRDDELSIVGNKMPDWTGGIMNNLTYKNLALSFLVDFNIGGDFFSFTNYYGLGTGKLEETLQYRDEEHGGIPYYIDDNGKKIQLSGHTETPPNGKRIHHDGLILKGVTEEGIENSTLIAAGDYYINTYYWNYGFHELGLYDNSYIKFRELSLTYFIPEKFLIKTPITSLSVAFIGRNLFFIMKKIPHIDPESSNNSDNSSGWDYGAMPGIRSFGLKINIGF